MEGIYIYSCYISSNATIGEFANVIDRDAGATRQSPLQITGDFNAWALE